MQVVCVCPHARMGSIRACGYEDPLLSTSAIAARRVRACDSLPCAPHPPQQQAATGDGACTVAAAHPQVRREERVAQHSSRCSGLLRLLFAGLFAISLTGLRLLGWLRRSAPRRRAGLGTGVNRGQQGVDEPDGVREARHDEARVERVRARTRVAAEALGALSPAPPAGEGALRPPCVCLLYTSPSPRDS